MQRVVLSKTILRTPFLLYKLQTIPCLLVPFQQVIMDAHEHNFQFHLAFKTSSSYRFFVVVLYYKQILRVVCIPIAVPSH